MAVMSGSVTLADALAQVAEVRGLPAWHAAVGWGSFLTVEFGDSRTDLDYPEGQFHLWVEMAAWRIENESAVLVSSGDRELNERVQILNDHVLTAISVEEPSLDSVFRFDGGLRLTTFAIYSDYDSLHWTLTLPNGTYLTVGPGSTWGIDPVNEPRRQLDDR